MYFIREPGEGSLGLPEGRYEIPLIIQDKRFNSDGSIWYPTASLIPRIHPVWNPDYFGDLAVVNGTVMPFVAVEPRLYRFRILNAANSRFFDLQLRARSSRGPAFVQIGADLGFLPAPVALENLLLSNAERADVIIDFSPFDGEDIVMENVAPNPFPSGFSGEPMRIMQFRVRRRDGTRDRSRIPPVLPAAPPLHASAAVLTRNILLTEESVPLDLPPEYCPFRVPTRMLLEERRFMDPVITEPMAGTTEIWQFINGTPVAHPMHVHLAHMQVLGRQPFDLMKFMETGQIETVGAAQPPSPNEVNASKDTVRVDLGTITRTVVKFDLPAGARVRSGDRLQYVHHCHMLEHEDNDMMRPFDVLVP
jgi:spore coat protein A